ncbi:MAG TPA: preprotein translocase subunit SecE, partial [Methyloceanibacter sp.]|nr:preprotein translocase subunit SecE [Methyloceanibacter sp.]
VRAEVSKVTWPTRRETIITTIMVMMMSVAAALFFLGVDWVLSLVVQTILGMRFEEVKASSDGYALVHCPRLLELRAEGRRIH